MQANGIINLGLILGLGLITMGCGAGKQQNENTTPVAVVAKLKASAPASVTLTSRYTGGDYVSASYSFRFMSQDVNQTHNNWEVLFEGRADFEDFFQVQTVVDDFSSIFDLGEKSCADIKSWYPEDRKTRPLVWLAYSDADPSELKAASTAKVNSGHCYLAYNNDEDGRVVTFFHVKDHVKSKTVTIDEIEVLDLLIRN